MLETWFTSTRYNSLGIPRTATAFSRARGFPKLHSCILKANLSRDQVNHPLIFFCNVRWERGQIYFIVTVKETIKKESRSNKPSNFDDVDKIVDVMIMMDCVNEKWKV